MAKMQTAPAAGFTPGERDYTPLRSEPENPWAR